MRVLANVPTLAILGFWVVTTLIIALALFGVASGWKLLWLALGGAAVVTAAATTREEKL